MANSEDFGSLLFSPLALRDIELRNRIVISPMCQYSADRGAATDWHMVHLGQFALGGAGLVMTEAAAVEERGRITHGDLGIWDDGHIAPLRRITDFLKSQGAVPALQLAHAGRKSSIRRPWQGGAALDELDASRNEPPWTVVAPSPVPFEAGSPVPQQLTIDQIRAVQEAWRAGAARAAVAGFDVIEIHGAHGYLIHQFLSSVTNTRADQYGGNLKGRMRFALEICEMVREVWPPTKPLFFRLSALDDADCDWSLEDTCTLVDELTNRGVDVIDCSTGGIAKSGFAIRGRRIPGYQVGLAAQVRNRTKATIMAVGLITEPEQAEKVLRSGQADLVAVGREALFNPHWPVHAAMALKADADYARWPAQYGWWLNYRAKSLAQSR